MAGQDQARVSNSDCERLRMQSPGRLACANSDNSEPLTLRAIAAERRKGRSNHRSARKPWLSSRQRRHACSVVTFRSARDGRAITSCGVLQAQEPIASMAPHVSQPDRNALLSAQRRLWLGAVILGDGGGFEQVQFWQMTTQKTRYTRPRPGSLNR